MEKEIFFNRSIPCQMIALCNKEYRHAEKLTVVINIIDSPSNNLIMSTLQFPVRTYTGLLLQNTSPHSSSICCSSY